MSFEVPPNIRQWWEAERAKQCTAHAAGTTAEEVSAALAQNAESLLIALYRRAIEKLPEHERPQLTLIGLGSLARRELCPFSDIDIVVLAADPRTKRVRRVVDDLLYPLWDARLEIGHAVRSVKDFSQLVIHDETVRTTALDIRPLAGDPSLNERLQASLKKALRSRSVQAQARRLVHALMDDEQSATVYRLEPNLKIGPGGLRDLQRVWWLLRMIWGIDSWSQLLAHDLLDASGMQRLKEGHTTLLSLRLALHFVAGRRQDVLRFDLQSDVARHLGLQDGPNNRLAADHLLQIFYKQAKAVRAVSAQIIERSVEKLTPALSRKAGRVEGYELRRGALMLAKSPTALDCLRIFRVAQRHQLPLHVSSKALVSELGPHVFDEEFYRQPIVARLLIDILSDVNDDGRALELLHETGALELLLPEFSHVVGLSQRDMYHIYTVDAHLVYCACHMLRMLAGTAADFPPDFAHLAQHMARPHLLVLAALFHDIGKGYGHGHSERGAQMAKSAALRLGLSQEDIDDLEFLVREHLSLYRISQRRDLEDTALLMRFAETVEDVERLEMLLLLSYADAVTTGPDAWNEWKGSLLRELYVRVKQIIKGTRPHDKLELRNRQRLDEVAQLLSCSVNSLESWAARLLERHLSMHRPMLLTRHVQAVKEADLTGIACSVFADERRGGWEIVVVGPDRPGLLADLSGVLAAWGISIDAAHISGTRDGLAIDTFVVRHGISRLLDAHNATAFAPLLAELRDALQGKIYFAERLDERRRASRSLLRQTPTSPARVVYDLEAQNDTTVVDVFAPDRVGLLHDVTQAIFRAGASILLARVCTEGERAVDAFYVVHAHTGAVLTPEQRAQLAQEICHATLS